MIFVGIYGGIGHGKTTFANYLEAATPSSAHLESSDLIIDVANVLRASNSRHPLPNDIPAINAWLSALPAILKQQLGWTTSVQQLELTPDKCKQAPENYDKLFAYLRLTALQPELQTPEITIANKAQYRSLQQWLGGYLRLTVDAGIWFDEIVRRARALTKLNLVVASGLRYPADAERIRGAEGLIIKIIRPALKDTDSQDLTERQRDQIKPDLTIINDGSLEQLKACAQTVLRDLERATTVAGQTYRASASSA